MICRFKKIARCNHGLAMIEFAFILPLLVLFVLGTMEVARFGIINQKLDKLANAMADFTTQGTNVSSSNLTGYANAAGQIMKPFGFDGTIIFSSAIYFNNGFPPCRRKVTACISWQDSKLGEDQSKVGRPGQIPTLPGGYSINVGENIIIAEVYWNYSPLIPLTGKLVPALASRKMYKIAIFKPRIGNLSILSDG